MYLINLKCNVFGKKVIRIPIKGLHLDDHVKLEVTRGAEEEHWPPVLVVFTHRGAHLFRYLRYFQILENIFVPYQIFHKLHKTWLLTHEQGVLRESFLNFSSQMSQTFYFG